MKVSLDMLALLNGLATRVKTSGLRGAANLEEKLEDAGLDSLDIVLLSIYVCEIFGIAEEAGKSLRPLTFGDLVRFAEEHATREPSSVESALAEIDGD